MTQLTQNLFAVEVPEDVKDIKIQPGQPEVLDYEYQMESRERDTQWGNAMIDLPPGSWQLLCTTREAQDKDTICLKGESIIGLSNLPELLASKGLDLNKNYVLLKKK